jgi:hypothetical protein
MLHRPASTGLTDVQLQSLASGGEKAGCLKGCVLCSYGAAAHLYRVS